MSTPSSDKRKNYHTVRYGTAEGELKFGHLHRDNELSGVMLRNGSASSKGNHYITLDSSGVKDRTNGTICSSPGAFQVKAGLDLEKEDPQGESKNVGIYLDAKNGDIVIRAPSGRIRMEAIDIDIVAVGQDNEKGTVSINGNEKVVIKAQTIDASSKVASKFFSEKTVEVVGNGVLNIYGGMIDAADGATQQKGSKVKSKNEENHRQGFSGGS